MPPPPREPNLKISYIPSSSLIPEMISESYAKKYNLQIENLVTKQDGFKVSKNLETWDESLQNAFLKYEIDENKILADSLYFIIDDVFGFGGSIVAVLKKIYDINHKANFFFCVVKDVRR